MLVLTRRPGEAILVGDQIRLVFVGMQHGQGKIGIEAPRGVRILREELEPYVDDEAETGDDGPRRSG